MTSWNVKGEGKRSAFYSCGTLGEKKVHRKQHGISAES